jgi:hypothetical protein
LDDSFDTKVTAVLLAFGMLDKAQRQAFAEHFNKFMYGSPQRQRQSMEYWSTRCRESENPTVRMIAESSAVYAASTKRRRKPRRPK